MITNPFLYGNPVQPDQFIGRRAILRRVVGRILNQGQSTALVGEPRLGKTSLLHYLEAAQTRATLYGAKAERIYFSYLDTQPLSSDCNLTQFWELALRTLERNGVSTSLIGQQLAQSRATDHNIFALETLFQALHDAGCQLVLLIDEFDRLLHHPLLSQAQFFGTLRSLASRSKGAFTLIIASSLSLARLNAETQRYNPTGSPFFNIFDEVTLGTLTAQESDHLLNVAGERFTVDDRHFIHSLAGGHPYLLQSTAAAMWEAYAEDMVDATMRQLYVLEELRRNQYQHFAKTWHVWSPPTRQAFTAVALLNTNTAALPALGLDLLSFRERMPQLLPELNALNLTGVITRKPETPDGWQVAQRVLLTWLWDELIREIRDENTLSRWLQGAELDGRLNANERQDLWQLFTAVRQLTIVNTGGGLYIGGNVQNGGDFIGRDQTKQS